MCYGCINLTEVVLSNNITVIPDYAFENCTSLEKINFPSSLLQIRYDAFKGTSLKEFHAPNSLKEIWDYAFKDAKQLTNVNLNNVTKLGTMSFENCEKLETINLPNTLKEVGQYVFNGCKKLVNINMPDKAISIKHDMFTGTGFYEDINNWDNGVLYVDNYLVFSKRPYDLVEVVRRLRSQGVKIDLCKEEKKKRAELLKKKEAFAHNNDIQKIIDYYSEKPTNFEGLCSELFESLGYAAKQTPPTNDGGYDILLSKGAEKTIVECKCYSIEHRVGRPSIQKLVGANNIVLANKMLFITTSDFSVAAISYAEEVGVELINGNKLMELLDKQGFIEKEKVKINVMECQLEIADLDPYVPRDIYERFFE